MQIAPCDCINLRIIRDDLAVLDKDVQVLNGTPALSRGDLPCPPVALVVNFDEQERISVVMFGPDAFFLLDVVHQRAGTRRVNHLRREVRRYRDGPHLNLRVREDCAVGAFVGLQSGDRIIHRRKNVHASAPRQPRSEFNFIVRDERLNRWVEPQCGLVCFLRARFDSEFSEVVLVVGERPDQNLRIIVVCHRRQVRPECFVDVRVVLGRCQDVAFDCPLGREVRFGSLCVPLAARERLLQQACLP